MERYFGGFAEKGWREGSEPGWGRVKEEFDIDMPEPEEVIFAAYDEGNYEGSADVVYRQGDTFFYASGNHCSCFGLENQWAPEPYKRETLAAALERGWMDDDRRKLILERIA